MVKINLSKSRTILSNVTYAALNLLLPAASLALIIITNSWVPSLVLVLLSKWRTFAVRPRYWFINIKSNLVDTIVGVSFIVFMYSSLGAIWQQVAIAVLYASWLLFIKPKSTQKFIQFQAACAAFLGISATVAVFYNISSIVLVGLCFLIGYAVARHALTAEDEPETRLLSFIFGLIIAELSWISYHWMISYTIPATTIKIPQLSILAALVSFVSINLYNLANQRDEKVKLSDISLPMIFSVSIIIIMLLGFSNPQYIP